VEEFELRLVALSRIKRRGLVPFKGKWSQGGWIFLRLQILDDTENSKRKKI
jgi:hypothetical protein